MRYCLHVGCRAIVRRGFCAKHERKESDRPQPHVRDWYHSPRWRKLRAWKLAQSPHCQECAKQGIIEQATDVDHVQRHRGLEALFWDLSNLQSLCHRCHARKTIADRFPRGKSSAFTGV